jgi:hypothetical protein
MVTPLSRNWGLWIRFDGCNRLRSKLEDGAVYLSIERFCAVEGDGKELAKLWVWMKTTEQTPFLASVSEAHESDYACMRHRRGHAGDAVSNTRSTCWEGRHLIWTPDRGKDMRQLSWD